MIHLSFYFWSTLCISSCIQAGISTIISIGGGLLVAHALVQQDTLFSRGARSLLPMLSIMPTKLLIFALGSWCPNGYIGIVLAHIYINIPFAAYSFISSYDLIDEHIILSARNLGAGMWQAYKTIIIPLLMPSIWYCISLIFFLCFFSHSIPVLLATYWYHHTPDSWIALHGNSIEWGYILVGRITIAYLLILFLPKQYFDQEMHRASVKIHLPSHIYNSYISGLGNIIFFGSCMPFILLCYAACSYEVGYFYIHALYMLPHKVLGIPIIAVVMRSFSIAVISACGAVLYAIISMFFLRSLKKKHISFNNMRIYGMIFCMFVWIIYMCVWIVKTDNHIPIFWRTVLYHIVLNYRLAANCLINQVASFSSEWSLTAQSCGATKQQVIKTILFPFVRCALIKSWCIAYGLSLTEVSVNGSRDTECLITLPVAIRMFRVAGDLSSVIACGIILLVLVICTGYFIERYA